jgi:hypothetical protein
MGWDGMCCALYRILHYYLFVKLFLLPHTPSQPFSPFLSNFSLSSSPPSNRHLSLPLLSLFPFLLLLLVNLPSSAFSLCHIPTSRYLTFRCLTLLYLALPCLTLPYLTSSTSSTLYRHYRPFHQPLLRAQLLHRSVDHRLIHACRHIHIKRYTHTHTQICTHT